MAPTVVAGSCQLRLPAGVGPLTRRASPPRRVIRCAAETQTKAATADDKKTTVPGTTSYKKPLRNRDKADIYIGKGKTIRDDPSKYPDRTELTGGWAGGELGMWQFRETAKADAQKEVKASPGLELPKFLKFSDSNEQETFTARVNGKEVQGPVRGSGNDIIYIGKESFIKDEGRKYPDKEDVGFIYGATGGFAGGEEGLKKFLETGDVPLLKPGEKPRTRIPALLYVFGAGAAAATALAIKQSSIPGGEEGGIAGGASFGGAASFDSLISSLSTPQVEVGAAAVGVLLLAFLTKSAVTSTVQKVQSAADVGARLALFAGLLVLALKAVFES